MELTIRELEERRRRFCAAMDGACPGWDTALVVSKVNQYYFTGTMQDALLVLRRGGGWAYYVRRSCRRAEEESPLRPIRPMGSYRDAAEGEGAELGNTYIEGEVMPWSMVERLKKHFRMASLGSLEQVIRWVRAVKSPYELAMMERSGELHHRLLTREVPPLLREGITEAELVGQIQSRMMALGFHGLARFSMFQTEVACGQIAFGVNSLYPTSFDGPGGAKGACAAAPVAGSPERALHRGDLVFVDLAFGVEGYHTDKTQVYYFGGRPPEELSEAHRFCMELQQRIAARLRPGEIPAQIYREVMEGLDASRREHFMGFQDRCVRFLGHGVGLHVDELPVVAEGFDSPLEENMVLALEPKKGVAGVGMAGVEDTYVVAPGGGRCITGGARDIIAV